MYFCAITQIRPPSLHSVREINDMRANKQLCDAKIEVDDGSFYVSKKILVSFYSNQNTEFLLLEYKILLRVQTGA